MHELFTEVAKRCDAGERVALCTVIDARGSTPQRRGARMLVTEAGQMFGTLGGGCVEAEVRKRALESLASNESLPTLSFRLDHDLGWDDGMWCGGILDVYVQLQSGPDAATEAARIASELRSGKPALIRIPEVGFMEELASPPQLVIAGAGHVARAVSALAAPAGFAVTVIDDRPDYASSKRFPEVGRIIVGEIDRELHNIRIDDNTYLVIVTRGHQRDAAALEAVIRSNARYIGMIGSKKKVRTILGNLADQGVDRHLLDRVRAPIGLEIGAVTPEEIAISVLAELIAVRRGVDEVKPMRLSKDELDQWLQHKPT